MQTHSNQTTIPPVTQNSTTGQRSSRWRRGVCVWNWRLPACLPYQRHLWPVNLSLKTHDHTTLTLQHNGQLLLLLCVWLAHYIFHFIPKEVSTARDRERFSGGHCARFLSAAEPTEQEQGEAVPPYETTYHSQPATIAVEYPQYKNPINNYRQTGDMIYKQIEESGRQMTSLAYGELPHASEIGRLKPPKTTTTSACLFISLHG